MLMKNFRPARMKIAGTESASQILPCFSNTNNGYDAMNIRILGDEFRQSDENKDEIIKNFWNTVCT